MGIAKRLLVMLAVFFAAGVLYSAPAAAQATRTWVSGVGDDVNPCSRTAPCKTFAGAISKTAAGGEINCLDPAGYGTVTVTKSITIDCTAQFGSILASSTTGVIINGADVVVTLRGLTINGGPPTSPGVNGVRVLQADHVLIENVQIFNFNGAAPNGAGVMINPTSNPASGVTTVAIVRSTIYNNGQGGGVALLPSAASVAVNLSIDDSTIYANGDASLGGAGVNVNTGAFAPTLKVDVTNSFLSGNNLPNTSGIVIKVSSGTVSGTVTGTRIVNHTTVGFRMTGGTFFVGTSTISGNATGVNVGGGTMTSYGNNMLGGNTANGSFSGTTPTS